MFHVKHSVPAEFPLKFTPMEIGAEMTL
jgi:hypothetical protein